DTTLFKNQLRKIIDAIQKTLGAFPGKEPEALQHTSGESRLCVFFADVADTLQTHRERLVADIEDRDGVVLGDISLGSSKKHEASVKNALQQACFSIHLFDQWPGRKMIDKKEVSYPCIQLDLALKSDIPQIIWVPENLNYKSIQDETYRKWLEALENAGRKQKNHEFIRGTPGAFSEYILQKIAALQKSASPYRKTLSCLVDTHQKDQQRAFELSAVLSQKGIDVEFNKESYDPIRSLENFEDAIKHVKNLILIFGSVNPSWLHGRIKKAVNIAAERFHADAPIRLENIWVYLLPGSKNLKSLQRIPGMFNIKTLDNSHSQDIDPKVISPLLQPQYTGENA
ncbi:MAG: hypothetical protein ACE5I1_32020, partial [bacterium]